ncbi:MAG: DUF2029 domain-containing protein [Deltaproteobacteria bacterium]|nr:DUF2029 domain-containing protein [Deltaproteobacteria bacterium]
MPSEPPPPPGLVRRAPARVAVAAFLAVVAASTYRAVERHAFEAHGDRGRWAMTDFRDTLYYPAVAFRAGANPWAARFADDHPVQRPLPPYGPVVVLAHWPLGLLPVHVAEVVYFLSTIGLAVAVAGVALRTGGLDARLPSVLALATLLLLSRPGQQNLLLGQCTLEVVLGCYLGLLQGARRPALGALGIVLASMKPQFALPLALLMLARGDLRAVAAGVAATGALSLGTLLAAGGPDGPAAWIAAIGRSNATVADPAVGWTRIDAGFLAGRGLALPEGAELTAGAAALLLGLAAFRRALATGASTAAPDGLALALACLTILLPLYHVAYDALLLTLPIVALVAAARTPARAHAALIALLLVPAVNQLASYPVVRGLAPGEPAWRIVTGINAAALVAALLHAAWLARRRPRFLTRLPGSG